MLRVICLGLALMWALIFSMVAWAGIGASGHASEQGTFERNLPDGARFYSIRVHAPSANGVYLLRYPFDTSPDSSFVAAGEKIPFYNTRGFTGFKIVNGDTTTTRVYWDD